MDWTKDQVMHEIGRIRDLKGVKEAYMTSSELVVVTRNLNHRNSWFGLPSIEIRMPIVYVDAVSFGYKYANWFRLTGHPVLGGSASYRIRNVISYRVCVGIDNLIDYLRARSEGPLMTVVQQLAMLQTVGLDDNRYQLSGYAVAALVLVWGCFVFLLSSAITK